MGSVLLWGEKVNRVDVILVHGITVKLDPANYYTNFVEGIRKNLPVDADVNFHPIAWNELLYRKEQQVYRWMDGLKWSKMRYIGCTLIGDVLAYSPPEGIPAPGDFYFDVNRLLETEFDRINNNYPKSKKVIIAHSLGTQIAFGFAWKREIDLLVTMGSPILYFSVRFKDFGKFPEATLHRMVNFYNPFDPISTVVSRNPALKACKDVRITSWNPINMLPMHAHSHYWSAKQVHEDIATEILKLSN